MRDEICNLCNQCHIRSDDPVFPEKKSEGNLGMVITSVCAAWNWNCNLPAFWDGAGS